MTDRLSALREAVDDLHRWEFSGEWESFNDILARIDAGLPPTDPETLNVERLAKALCIEHGPEFDEARLHVDDACHVQARSVAATYARLARAYEAATPAPEVELIRCSIPACNGDHEPTHYHVAQPPATTGSEPT